MSRALAVAFAIIAFSVSLADAQQPLAGAPGPWGSGPYDGYGQYPGYGFTPYGGYAFTPYGGYGYGPFSGLNVGYGYGPWNYAQQLYQQQSSLAQQVFQQQQQAIIDQIGLAEQRLERLDANKQQMFQQLLNMKESDKQTVRAGLMQDYLKLNPRGREGWKRDPVVQAVIGEDLPRLDGFARFQDMDEADKSRFRQALLDRYRSLAPAQQESCATMQSWVAFWAGNGGCHEANRFGTYRGCVLRRHALRRGPRSGRDISGPAATAGRVSLFAGVSCDVSRAPGDRHRALRCRGVRPGRRLWGWRLWGWRLRVWGLRVWGLRLGRQRFRGPRLLSSESVREHELAAAQSAVALLRGAFPQRISGAGAPQGRSRLHRIATPP